MNKEELHARIRIALLTSGPLTSAQLEKELGMKWTDFSPFLMEMIRSLFNPQGEVIQKKEEGVTTYKLA